MRHYNPQKKQKIRLYILLALIIGTVFYIATADEFERDAPLIATQDGYWNPTNPLQITISDKSPLKSYEIVLISENERIVLASQEVENQKELAVDAYLPKNKSVKNGKVLLEVKAVDRSKWNFFMGNQTKKSYEIIVDQKNPVVNIIEHSYAVALGGSALVVFEATDENLDKIVVNTGENSFDAAPFYKDGFYVALIARSVYGDDFAPFVIATDKAGNQTRKKIPLYQKNNRYKQSNITLSDRFLDGKIDELHYHFDKENRGKPLEKIEKFQFVNEILRDANEIVIQENTKNISQDRVKSFHIEPFRALPNSKVVGHFGDKRDFFYNSEKISTSYHLGIDFASVKEDNIISTNAGTVSFANDNGIYGNMVIIDHGLGLFSVYGHTSQMLVGTTDWVEANATIAQTGVSGLALGDHLHFELRIQSVAVTPLEWLDSSWIKTNINKVVDDAKKTIDSRE